jgi:allantoicase
MDGSIILRRLAALMRSCVIQTAPAYYFDGGYQRIRCYGRTNGRTFDLPRSILGGRIIEVSGQRGGKFSSQARHSPF